VGANAVNCVVRGWVVVGAKVAAQTGYTQVLNGFVQVR